MRHSDRAILHHHGIWIWNDIGRIHSWAIGSLLRDTGHRYSSGVWLTLLLRVKHHLLLLLLLLRHLGLWHLGLLCGRIMDVTWLLRRRLLLRRRIWTRRKGILRCIHGLCSVCSLRLVCADVCMVLCQPTETRSIFVLSERLNACLSRVDKVKAALRGGRARKA